jgi:hypothetical protein
LFEAIEIDNPVFDSALAAELCTQLAATQEIPRRSFGLGLVVPEFANALGWDTHGASIAGLGVRGGSLVQAGSNPSPVPLRLMRTPAAGHPLPRGEGRLLIRVISNGWTSQSFALR